MIYHVRNVTDGAPISPGLGRRIPAAAPVRATARPKVRDAAGDSLLWTAEFRADWFDVQTDGDQIVAYLTKPGTIGRPVMARFPTAWHDVKREGAAIVVYALSAPRQGSMSADLRQTSPATGKLSVGDSYRRANTATSRQLEGMNASARKRWGNA